MRTVEEYNDIRDCKPTFSAPAETWAQMAKREGHRKKHPQSMNNDQSVGRNHRKQIAQLFAEHGPMTSHKVCELMGLTHPTVNQNMSTMRAEGTLISVKGCKVRGLNVLASQVNDYPELFPQELPPSVSLD